LNPRPPAYEMKNRNVRRISCSALQDIRRRVRTGFSIDQIFYHDRISAYSWELGRTAHETGDCNHAVTRKSAAPAFVRFWGTADNGGIWPTMVCPLMTQSGRTSLTVYVATGPRSGNVFYFRFVPTGRWGTGLFRPLVAGFEDGSRLFWIFGHCYISGFSCPPGGLEGVPS
jgi:hypothetical protein